MSEVVVLTIVETCEARGGLFKSQEGSRKEFSPLGRCCEARAGLLKGSRKQFSPLRRCCEARAILFNARKHRERSFHHYEGSVKLVEAYLSARKDRDSSFHHCGGAVNLMLAWLRTSRHREKAVFTTLGVLRSSWRAV